LLDKVDGLAQQRRSDASKPRALQAHVTGQELLRVKNPCCSNVFGGQSE